jgi:hypothetical protein
MLYKILTPPVQSSAGLLWDSIELDEASAAELIRLGVVALVESEPEEPAVVEVAGIRIEVEPEPKPTQSRRGAK